MFSAHSTRGAATSKAKDVTVDILKAANWSSESTSAVSTTDQSLPLSLVVGCSRVHKPNNGEL